MWLFSDGAVGCCDRPASACSSNGSVHSCRDFDSLTDCASQVTIADCSPEVALGIDHLPIICVKHQYDSYWEWFRAPDFTVCSESFAAECLKFVKHSRRAGNPLVDRNGYFNLHHEFDIGQFLCSVQATSTLKSKCATPSIMWLGCATAMIPKSK